MFDAGKLLNQMLGAGAQAAKGAAPQARAAAGQVGGLLGSLLSNSVAGLQQGASDIEKNTGVGAKVDGAVRGATGGKGLGDLLAQARDLASQNKVATGAAIGGIGALLLGTKTGRGVAGGAAALGGLALIGGLAYKAYRDHQAGKAPVAAPAQLEGPPAGAFAPSGEPAADNATAMLLIRAMIAAAACDGLVDNEERSRIVGGLAEAGLDTHAAQFLDHEFANPASIRDLAAAAVTPELAFQAYAAARLAIEPDSAVEKSFLSDLAAALKITPEQVAHLDAAASGAKAG
jgi:uncharacterized membrane protein YebE (DUF533 family)